MRIYLGDTCLEKLFELPKKVQKKVIEFQKKFKENPYGHAINLESISTFVDDSIKTARIGDDYRAIIGCIPGDDYCMLYVDHHDEAMQWAENKRFEQNQHTGAFQVIPVVTSVVTPQVTSVQVEQLPFASYSDEQLLKIGVPAESLVLVKSIKDLDDLDNNEKNLPTDVFEHLFDLLDEKNIDQVIAEIEEGKSTSDDAANSANNKSHFIEITGENQLEEYLDGDFERWQIFLHPSQRILVESNYKGSVKVTGGGGTGKTVAALHRLKKLTTDAPRKSVLYTTYTKALVTNIKDKIKKLGVNEDACVILNIDALLEELAKKYGIKQTEWNVLDYINVGYGKTKGIEIWEEIVNNNLTGFEADFLYQEYLDVIAYNNVETLEQYLRQPRVGRTKALSIKQRKEIWGLVEQYVEAKQQGKYFDRSELYNLVATHLKNNDIHPFSHIIADEIQDFSNPELRFLRALVAEGENDLFMVGDPYQRIYNNRQINFSKVGLNVRGKRSRRLKINYRTTEEIKRQAVSIVKGCTYDDFDGEAETLNGYVSLMHGPKPEYTLYTSVTEERNGVLDFVTECRNNGVNYADIAIACRKRDELKEIQSALHIAKVPYKNIDGSSMSDKDGIVLSTLHNMKGLEFKVVIIMGINKDSFPSKPHNWSEMNKKEQTNHLMNQRSLMYVAITRAMQMVRITGVGDKSELL